MVASINRITALARQTVDIYVEAYGLDALGEIEQGRWLREACRTDDGAVRSDSWPDYLQAVRAEVSRRARAAAIATLRSSGRGSSGARPDARRDSPVVVRPKDRTPVA